MEIKLKKKETIKKEFATVSISKEHKAKFKEYCKENKYKMTEAMENLIEQLTGDEDDKSN